MPKSEALKRANAKYWKTHRVRILAERRAKYAAIKDTSDRRAKRRTEYVRNREQIRAASKRRRGTGKPAEDLRRQRAADPERFARYARVYAEKHADTIRARAKEARAQNKEAISRFNRAYRDAHKAELIAYVKLWRQQNPKKCAAYSRKKIEKDPAAYSAYQTAYRNLKREILNRKCAERNALIRELRAGMSSAERKEYRAFVKSVRQSPRMKCYWCDQPTTRKNRQIDNIIPIKRGGADRLHNLCVSCRKCNHAKRAKMPSDFASQMVMTFGGQVPRTPATETAA